MLKKNTIYNMDCLDGLKQLPDNCADLMILDPPYYFGPGLTEGGGFMKDEPYLKEIDALNEPVNTAVLDECLRVLKAPNLYVWCNKKQVGQYIQYFEGQGCLTDILTWHKTNPIPATSNTYLPDTEYCLFFRKQVPLYGTYETKRKYWLTTLNQKDKARYGHPTIKPLAIIRQLIYNSTAGGGASD